MKRVDVKRILRDPIQRRELCVRVIIATQAREGVETTRAQAERAYDYVVNTSSKRAGTGPAMDVDRRRTMATTDRIEYGPDGNARAFVGRGAVEVFRGAALASGLRLYAKTGLRPNRAWTLKAMLHAATGITGTPYAVSKRAALVAADDLSAWVQAEKARLSPKEDKETPYFEDSDIESGRYDDDPNPYEGTYSEE